MAKLDAIVPPSIHLGVDTPAWRWNDYRSFTTSSAYKAISNIGLRHCRNMSIGWHPFDREPSDVVQLVAKDFDGDVMQNGDQSHFYFVGGLGHCPREVPRG
ncbi:hypothetical protein V6N11_009264 [Hibiscus sabdariffa]|uniref:Uncharacterized protein n=2 Tax=Hibiscus sabdariffa TaxID=183260 RepID=A0ABR2PQK0_9ROSI